MSSSFKLTQFCYLSRLRSDAYSYAFLQHNTAAPRRNAAPKKYILINPSVPEQYLILFVERGNISENPLKAK